MSRRRSWQLRTVFSCAPPMISRVMMWAMRMRTGEARSEVESGIFDADEEQSVRRGGLAGEAAVAGGEDLGGPLLVAAPLPHFDQRADDRTDHIVQEAVAGDFERDAIGQRIDSTATRRVP